MNRTEGFRNRPRSETEEWATGNRPSRLQVPLHSSRKQVFGQGVCASSRNARRWFVRISGWSIGWAGVIRVNQGVPAVVDPHQLRVLEMLGLPVVGRGRAASACPSRAQTMRTGPSERALGCWPTATGAALRDPCFCRLVVRELGKELTHRESLTEVLSRCLMSRSTLFFGTFRRYLFRSRRTFRLWRAG